MSWNIWDWNKRKNGVRERETQLAEAEENLRRIRNRVQIDLEKDLRKVRRSDAAVNAAHASVTARAEVRRVAGDQVETGMVTASALKEAEGALAGAQADLLQAELNQRLAAAELKRTAGGR